jgi:CDP-glucose 4,6-dehydratase
VVNEVKKTIPSIKTEVSASKEKLHEANLLQLNIDKAVKNLDWKPKLNFKETIQFTIDGYLQELENKNLYDCRVEQIKAYCNK